MQNRLAVMLGAVALAAGSAVHGQQPTPPANDATGKASFEVVSIKSNKSGDERGRMRFLPGGRLDVVNMPIWHLIAFAYPMEGYYKHLGGPRWLNSERYDMTAKLEGSSIHLIEAMRTLLADRFGLKVHRETRPLDIYALELARPGEKPRDELKPSAEACAPGGPPLPTGALCRVQLTLGRMKAVGGSMSQLANSLAAQVGRVVVDQTGLKGRWDFELTFAPEPPVINLPPDPSAAPPIADAPSIFTALQEKLGLKLVSTKGPVDVVVIDDAERPTED